MKTEAIRQRLHQFIETAEEKKVKAIYTLFEDEITQDKWEYTDEFKAELDRRYSYYKNGGKMVSATEADRQIRDLLKRGRKQWAIAISMNLKHWLNTKKLLAGTWIEVQLCSR